MDNSVYIALSRQMTQFRDLDVTANNIANSNTVGFQAEKTMFTDFLVEDGNRRDMAFSQDIASYHNLEQGTMNVTGNALDVAIQGEGYFSLATPEGVRYTRAGNFQIDPNGTLMSAEGFPVLDDGGQRIQFEERDVDILIGENGRITVNGQERGQIGVVEFNNRQELKRTYSTMFDANGQNPQIAVRSRVLQGTLENSNVKPVTELVRLTELSRSTGSTAKFIEVMYDLQRKASSTWAKQQ